MRELLWTPSEEVQKASNMYAFMELVNREKGRNYRNYRELYRFSVDEPEAYCSGIWTSSIPWATRGPWTTSTDSPEPSGSPAAG